jgi:plasmid replication initiation protein
MSLVKEGGIREYQDLTRFTASSADVALKDQIDLMARCWFSLTSGRTKPIEHSYVDARSNLSETVRITGSAEHGIATIHDQDILIFAISQWVDAKRHGLEFSRRIHFTPYQLLAWMNREPSGGQYQRIRDALHRLKTTSIETTIRSQAGNRKRNRTRQFSWISEWEITEENGEIRGIEVVLTEWLFESIQNFHVLTLDKRYFDIPGSVERWLYQYARKATGGPAGVWKESFRSLYQKSASQQDYKHYANTLRKLIKKDALPGMHLEQCKSTLGKDMLLMARHEKREVVENKPAVSETQLELVERTPLEDAWENVLEIMRKQFGEATVKSWFNALRPLELEGTTLTYHAPTKFIADWIETHYSQSLRDAWKETGHRVSEIRFEVKQKKKAA